MTGDLLIYQRSVGAPALPNGSQVLLRLLFTLLHPKSLQLEQLPLLRLAKTHSEHLALVHAVLDRTAVLVLSSTF